MLSSWGEATDTMLVGTLSNPGDYSTFTLLETFSMDVDYQQYTVEFSETNTDKYIAFVNPLTSTYGYSLYIDDVSWEPAVSLPNPAIAVYPTENASNVLIDFDGNAMTNSFQWASSGGNPTSYSLNIGTDNPPTNMGSGIELGDTLIYHFDIPLEYSTQYFWQIIPQNENGAAEDCPVWSFTTMSNSVIDFNQVDSFSEGFESAEVGYLPLGMEQENVADDNSMWAAIANSAWSENAHTGNQAVHLMFSFMEAQDDWLYTQPMNLIAGNDYELSFWYKCSQFEDTVERLAFYAGYTPIHTAMTTELWNNDNITNLEYEQVTINYTPEESGITFFSWHCYSDPLQYVIFVDDFSIIETENSDSEDDVINNVYSLSNFPNPFNPTTEIFFGTTLSQNASIEIYNTKGQKVKDFSSIEGKESVIWNGLDNLGNPVGSGLYFYRLNVNGNTKAVKRCMLLK